LVSVTILPIGTAAYHDTERSLAIGGDLSCPAPDPKSAHRAAVRPRPVVKNLKRGIDPVSPRSAKYRSAIARRCGVLPSPSFG
jgi:hypothetical protein